MMIKASFVTAVAFVSGLFLSTNLAVAAADYDVRPKDIEKAEVDRCRNANTLVFIRASFFNQASPTGTTFSDDSYSRSPEKGRYLHAGSRSPEEGRAATASLNYLCKVDPAFRFKNPADPSGSYVGIKPNLDTPRALPLPKALLME